MENIQPDPYEYGQLRSILLKVEFIQGKAEWTALIQREGWSRTDQWIGSTGWSSPEEALAYELEFEKRNARRQNEVMNNEHME